MPVSVSYMVTNPADSDEFHQIIEENYQRVYGIIYRFIGDQQEAEDLTQDTFVNAYRAWDQFRGDSQVYTWLYRIAVNLSKNRLERRARHQQFHGFSLDAPLEYEQDDSQPRDVEDWSRNPELMAESQELGQVVAAQVSKLRPDYQAVVVLRDYEQLSYEQIAQVLGCSVQAVKSRLFRARSTLRQKLQRYLDPPG